MATISKTFRKCFFIALFPNHKACSGHAGYCCHAVQSKGLSLGIRLGVWLKAHGELSCRAMGSLY